MGTLADGHDNVLCGRGVVWDQIAPHDIPPLADQCQLEADNVCDMESESLHIEVIRCAKKYGKAATVCAWRLGSHNPVSTRILRVDSLG